ncbi:hypothetical protein RYH73_25460 [Olivibacter sp. CPCC 100613]|uniref:DUF7674 family protein n=1 Tax=Olivibacter sp. CPCC 100613 TaxID=3079931 RepID=UPI002FF4EA57
MKKISSDDMFQIIAAELPEATEEIQKPSTRENLAALLQGVVNYLRDRLAMHEIGKVRYTMAFMGWVYTTSDEKVRDLVENLFIRSFNSLKRHCSKLEWEEIESSIPQRLFSIYLVQRIHEHPAKP